ncbi:MAG: glycoside hydrolase 3 protein [Sclerophora amabilis]|nr:MAG: glycoside hydrolase 3 protein [Sclerophora amabilis]
MRFTSLAPIALAIGPSVVAATGRLGLAIGTKLGDETSTYCKTKSDYVKEFEAIKSQTTLVRGYDASDCDFAREALPAAKQTGFKVILGIWPDVPESYAAGKAAVLQYAPEYEDQVYAVTVGSETLYRGNFTGSELFNDYIKDVKDALPKGIKVGTADSWNKYDDGTADAVIKGADIVLVNAFAYWQGQDIDNATATFFDDIARATTHIQDVKGSTDGIEIIVGETGWTTEGTKYKAAQPSVENAQKYWKTAICGIRDWGVDVFAFEAFDELWKPDSISDTGVAADEKHWGVYDDQLKPKYDLSC